MSSRLTRGRVPSSSVGACVRRGARRRDDVARPGCRVYARYRRPTGCDGAACRLGSGTSRPLSVGGAVGDEQLGQGVVAGGPARVVAAVAGGGDAAHVQRAGAVVGGGVHVGPGGEQDAHDLGRVAGRPGADRRVQRGAAGGRVAPVDVGAGRRAAAARAPAGRRRRRSAARRRRRRRPGRAAAAAAGAAPPKAAQDSRSTPLVAVAGLGAVVEVAGELVDVAEVGGARRVDLARRARAAAGTRSGRSCSATCSGVRLNSVRAVRSAPASTSTRTTSACPSATARCSGVQPPCPSRSTVRASRPGDVRAPPSGRRRRRRRR